MTARLRAQKITLRYGERVVSTRLSLDIPDGAFTAIVGPNACGKSTLLRAFVRLLQPAAGSVTFDGKDVHTYSSKALARSLAFLPQEPVAPEGIRVRQLQGRGRFPHQSLLSMGRRRTSRRSPRRWRSRASPSWRIARCAGAVRRTAATGVVAMVLAQRTPYLLLDEPTSFLDITHQYRLLSLFARLRDEGRTVIAVLHDINQACRFADHLVAVKEGRIVAEGAAEDIVDAALLKEVFDLPSVVVPDPVTGTPMVVPTM